MERMKLVGITLLVALLAAGCSSSQVQSIPVTAAWETAKYGTWKLVML